LGVIIDRELRWKEQGDRMVAKGQAWVAQIQRIARMTRGASPELIRRLYVAVAIPQIFYAADVCLVAGPRTGKFVGAAIVRRFVTVQRKAAITGAMRTTATDTLNAHANLMPVSVLINKVRARAALRLATIPTSHPLSTHVRRAALRRVKRHPAPLHGLMHDFAIAPKRMEKVDPAKANQCWRPGFKTRIAKSRQAAIEMDEDDTAPLQIYTESCVHHRPSGRVQTTWPRYIGERMGGW
jgi:hypothetical protein